MPSNHIHTLPTAGRYLLTAVVAASVAFAQSSAPVPTYSDQPPTTNPNGGWKRVGDASAQNQAPDPNSNGPTYNANGYPEYGQDPPYGQNPSDPNQAPPPASNPPNAQPEYQQPNAPQGGYGQPGYGQTPYGQQSGNQSYPPARYQAPPPVPRSLTIQQGTYVTVRVNQMLSSAKNQQGDAFTATLTQPLVVNGVVVAEPGQTLGGRVVMVQKHSTSNAAKLGVQLTNLTLVDGQQVPIISQFISRQGGTTPGGAEAGTVIATTGLGAAIGAAAGWGTGAAIGAGAGAVAGLIGVVVTHNHPSVIYPEQVLTFRLEAPVTISTANSPQAFRYVEPGEYDRPPSNGPGYGPGYATGPAPAPDYYAYAYGYPYPYPYYYPYWGPSFAFYYGPGYWWGGRCYYGRYYGPYRGYGGWNVHGYVGGRAVESHGTYGGGHVSGSASAHSAGGGGHR
ncbi:MAG: hypothetical protein JO033_22610 [Acidobacteriaceae bacterium]|nr:hypothetical protein [Acidobacteriaceae bacterium]MBV9500131.1 hypothetical protein [Acidobacteriaceae bacterium]